MNYFEIYAQNIEDIKISPKLKEIINSTSFGKYIKPYSSKREGCKELSYNQILGQGIKNLTQKILDHRKGKITLTPEEPIISQNEDEIKKTITLIYEDMFKKNIQEHESERKLMLNGATYPIRINFKKDELITETIYVKKPDTNRLIGWFLYNLISDTPPTKFGFNEKIFLEQEISGYTLQQEDDDMLLVLPEYKEGIGKAAARAEFLGLYEDVLAERNRIIDNNYATRLFDFDAIFEPTEIEKRGNQIMQHYAKKQAIDSNMVHAYRQEKQKISQRIYKLKDIILPFAEQANKLKDKEFDTIKEKIYIFSGHKGLKEYIISQAKNFAQ